MNRDEAMISRTKSSRPGRRRGFAIAQGLLEREPVKLDILGRIHKSPIAYDETPPPPSAMCVPQVLRSTCVPCQGSLPLEG